MQTITTSLGPVDISNDLLMYERKLVYKEAFGENVKPLEQSNLTKILDDVYNAVADPYVEAALMGFLEDVINYIENKGYEKPKSARMLLADGYSFNDDTGKGFFYFEHDDKGKLDYFCVKDWIEMHDGKHDVLYVASCNPAGIEVHTKKSKLIYPVTINDITEICLASKGLGSGILKLFVPVLNSEK